MDRAGKSAERKRKCGGRAKMNVGGGGGTCGGRERMWAIGGWISWRKRGGCVLARVCGRRCHFTGKGLLPLRHFY